MCPDDNGCRGCIHCDSPSNWDCFCKLYHSQWDINRGCGNKGKPAEQVDLSGYEIDYSGEPERAFYHTSSHFWKEFIQDLEA